MEGKLEAIVKENPIHDAYNLYRSIQQKSMHIEPPTIPRPTSTSTTLPDQQTYTVHSIRGVCDQL